MGVGLTLQKWPKNRAFGTGQEIGRRGNNWPRPLEPSLLFSSLRCSASPLWLVVRARARRPPSGTAETPAIQPGGELVASIRSEPATYNRYAPAGIRAATELVTLLTHAPLVRINRTTDQLEPWLAESWTTSPDGLTYTLKLREGVTFSDGEPLTSADVLFSFRAVYDPVVKSGLQPTFLVKGKPLAVRAPDPHTVVIGFPEPFAPGLRLLDMLPIFPKHKLEAALNAGKLAEEWVPSKPLTDIAGLGPFVLSEHVAGQRLVLTRNAHYFRRDAAGVQLPYLDRLILSVVADQSTEALRLEAGETDLMSNGEIRPQDYAGFKRLAGQSRLKLLDIGVGLDPDFLAFNLRKERADGPAGRLAADARVPSRRLGRRRPNGDRQRGVPGRGRSRSTGPMSPGNRTWYDASVSAGAFDPAEARRLLAAAGLRDGERRRSAGGRAWQAGAVFDPDAGRPQPRAGGDRRSRSSCASWAWRWTS